MYDIFLKDVDICNFDDTTTYISNKSLENVLKSLEKSSMLAIDSAKWRAQVPTCPTCSTWPTCPRGLRALRALGAHTPYVLYVPTCPSIFYRPEN